MKFSCDQCGTRYSIADQKVAGKRLRIRCKVCNYIMEVRGGGQRSLNTYEDSRSKTTIQATPPLQRDEWYYAIDGEPIGPLTLVALSDEIKHRRLHQDVLVWNERLTDWHAANTLPEFARLVPPPVPKKPPAVPETEDTTMGQPLGGAATIPAAYGPMGGQLMGDGVVEETESEQSVSDLSVDQIESLRGGSLDASASGSVDASASGSLSPVAEHPSLIPSQPIDDTGDEQTEDSLVDVGEFVASATEATSSDSAFSRDSTEMISLSEIEKLDRGSVDVTPQTSTSLDQNDVLAATANETEADEVPDALPETSLGVPLAADPSSDQTQVADSIDLGSEGLAAEPAGQIAERETEDLKSGPGISGLDDPSAGSLPPTELGIGAPVIPDAEAPEASDAVDEAPVAGDDSDDGSDKKAALLSAPQSMVTPSTTGIDVPTLGSPAGPNLSPAPKEPASVEVVEPVVETPTVAVTTATTPTVEKAVPQQTVKAAPPKSQAAKKSSMLPLVAAVLLGAGGAGLWFVTSSQNPSSPTVRPRTSPQEPVNVAAKQVDTTTKVEEAPENVVKTAPKVDERKGRPKTAKEPTPRVAKKVPTRRSSPSSAKSTKSNAKARSNFGQQGRTIEANGNTAGRSKNTRSLFQDSIKPQDTPAATPSDNNKKVGAAEMNTLFAALANDPVDDDVDLRSNEPLVGTKVEKKSRLEDSRGSRMNTKSSGIRSMKKSDRPKLDTSSLAVNTGSSGVPSLEKIDIDDDDVSDDFPRDEVTKIFNRERNGISTCYKRHLKKGGRRFKGQLTLVFSVEPNGKARKVSIGRKYRRTEMQRCLRKFVGRIKFPRFKGKGQKVSFNLKVQNIY